MALSPYTLIIGTKSDDPFNVIPNAPYEIRHRDTATGASLGLANIFSDPAGLVPITQTGATVNDRGTVVFYAEAVPLNAEYNNGTSIVQPIDVEKYRLMIADVPMYLSLVGYTTNPAKDYLFDIYRDAQLNSGYSVSYTEANRFRDWGLLDDTIHFSQGGRDLIAEAFAEDIWNN